VVDFPNPDTRLLFLSCRAGQATGWGVGEAHTASRVVSFEEELRQQCSRAARGSRKYAGRVDFGEECASVGASTYLFFKCVGNRVTPWHYSFGQFVKTVC
jgi:hypothetical protein